MSWVRNAARRRKQAYDCYSVPVLSGTQGRKTTPTGLEPSWTSFE